MTARYYEAKINKAESSDALRQFHVTLPPIAYRLLPRTDFDRHFNSDASLLLLNNIPTIILIYFEHHINRRKATSQAMPSLIRCLSHRLARQAWFSCQQRLGHRRVMPLAISSCNSDKTSYSLHYSDKIWQEMLIFLPRENRELGITSLPLGAD